MNTILQLTVHNHPGVMSHISGLFARRVFNVDGILCMPIENGARSRVWLRVQENERLGQLVKQLEKLIDVEEVRQQEIDPGVFENLRQFFADTGS